MFNRVSFSIGKALRESGQALDRLGSRVQGSYAFKERLNRHQRLMPLFDFMPFIGEGAFVAPSAHVIGQVELGPKSTIWYGAVVRGDVNTIKIGEETSIGDRVVVHVARHNAGGPRPTVIGNRVVVEDGAVLHACTIEDEAFVGAGAILLDGSHVEKNGIVEAGAVLTGGKRVKSNEVWAGNPARHVRDASADEVAQIPKIAARLTELSVKHREEHELSDFDRENRRAYATESTDRSEQQQADYHERHSQTQTQH